jgi:hypothetical protein
MLRRYRLSRSAGYSVGSSLGFAAFKWKPPEVRKQLDESRARFLELQKKLDESRQLDWADERIQ